ncbi:MAG: type II toxin-antitoxin system RelE/ParE family toxin [Acidobacteriia bacterium]|nr:type II toxin-antitoxin system RelE/ParE family toxin [Terriglobia bacterium]
MIRSFRDPEAEKLFRDQFSKKYRALERIARRKLLEVDAAESLDDLRALPGNRLEALKGDRKGQHSIRINDQYRICFLWNAPHASAVEIVDYH